MKKTLLLLTFAALLFSGCSQKREVIQVTKKPVPVTITKKVKQTKVLKPKKKVKLRKVEDNNYSSSYMYPGSDKAPKPTKVATTKSASNTGGMTKAECIKMIGQTKFNQYTDMLGSEAAPIKRCAMLKAM